MKQMIEVSKWPLVNISVSLVSGKKLGDGQDMVMLTVLHATKHSIGNAKVWMTIEKAEELAVMLAAPTEED